MAKTETSKGCLPPASRSQGSALEATTQLTEILSMQVTALEVALKDTDKLLRQVEKENDLLRRMLSQDPAISTPTAADDEAMQPPTPKVIERDRVTVLCHIADLLIAPEAGRTTPPAVAEACCRLGSADPARAHYEHVLRTLEQAKHTPF